MAIDREKALAAAQKYVEKKKYDKAVIEYQKVIQADPKDARTLLKLGDLQSKMDAYAEAVATYERVGKLYASQGFSLKAIAVYKQIREVINKHLPQLEDQYAHIAPKLADLYQQLGLTSDALAALDEVATRMQRQSKDKEAIEVFRKIVELDPTNPLPHLRLAEALSRAKDSDGAVLEFGIASGQLLKLGRREDALKVIERLLHHRADPTHARIAAELYLARNTLNDGLQSLTKLQICFQANPHDLDTLGLLARSFTQIGQAAKAIEVQKEMARIARDAGMTQLFKELVTKLTKIAPNDEGVRRLAEGSAPPSMGLGGPVSRKAEPMPEPEAEAVVEGIDESYEDVGEADIEEEPLELAQRSGGVDLEDDEISVKFAEVVDEVDEPATATGTPAQLAAILSEAAAFRETRLHAKAIEALRGGAEMAPDSIEVHQALRDVLLDAGRTQEAAAEMIFIARLLIEGMDPDAAASVLQEALALEPDDAVAVQMLRDLGYELVEEAAETGSGAFREAPPMRASQPSYGPDAPLPSYDLEEIGPEDVTRHSYPETASEHMRADAAANIDDPFGDGPLPSFPLEPTTEVHHDALPESAEGRGAVSHRRGSTPGTPELESSLEEAEFFATRGLFDDARAILSDHLARLPNHPLLLERLAELDAQERGGQNGSGPRPAPGSDEEDRAFDIAASLGAIEAERNGAASTPKLGAAADQVDVEEVFAKFKAGVAQQISVDDAQSHYELGIAYKEMALLDDAIREFETAARDPNRESVCHSMIGNIHLERGNINEAIDAFLAGLEAPERTKDQETMLSYEVGSAYEAKKMVKQALDYFQRVAKLTPTFRDVQERIKRLQKADPKPQPVRAVAVGADDEFDRAFDDLLAGGKP